MDARCRRRLDMARVVSQARDAGLDLLGDDVLVALPDDEMQAIFARLGRYPDGVTVVTRDRESLFIIRMDPAGPAGTEDQDPCPLHPETLVAMWVAYLRLKVGPVSCYLAPGYRMELSAEECVSAN